VSGELDFGEPRPELVRSSRDDRRPAFIWITVAATKTIRDGLRDDEPGLSQVLSTYTALIEIANENRARTAIGEKSSAFSVERQKIARYAGVSTRTVVRTAAALERIGLLEVERQNRGKQLPSRYVLVEPGDSESDHVTQGHADHVTQGHATTKEVKETTKKTCVNRKVVSDDELALTAAVVQAFNEIAGTRLKADPHLTPIVGRIREWPKLTAAQHRKVIVAVFAGEHWWTGPAGPRIIYGNAAQFEQSIELARAAAKKPAPFDINAEAARIRREQEAD
jgi:hypothetical protein